MDEDLAAGVEKNAAEWLPLLARLPWVEVHNEADVSWLYAGDAWPRNGVQSARFTAETADRRVGEILRFHLERKIACNWSVGPATQPSDLGVHLRRHGFHCMIRCAAMACELDVRPPAPAKPQGVTVKLVDNPPLLVPPTTERRRKRYEGEKSIPQFKPRQIWYASARIGDKVVGRTTLLAGAETAGVYDVDVLKEFGRRGIGVALVNTVLTQAKHLGYRTAVLSASGMGFKVYQRAGFREVGKLSYWKYGKMRQL